jgi:Uma2 family endonuclease
MSVPVVETGPMSVEDYFAFTDRRPDNEKWELIAGEPISHASPSRTHHRILGNLLFELGRIERADSPSWEVIPGIGVRVSDASLPEPGVIIRPNDDPKGDPFARECDDVLATFEILSPSTADRDMRWKRTAYASLASLSHYVIVAQDTIDVVVFARNAGLAERHLSVGDTLDLPAPGVSVPIAEIYRDTGLL